MARNAISKPDLLEQFFKHLQKAVTTGEATVIQEACLQDLILFYQGNPQQDGMFFDWDESGELVVHVENVSQAERRRKTLGLKPLEEARLLHKTEIEQTGGPPKDIKEHKRQALAWAKRVGWHNA